VLIRGINVGGKNKVSMTDLKHHLENLHHVDVQTYINSGNVILKSSKHADEIKLEIESQLPVWFKLDDETIKVLVISKSMLSNIIESKPEGFGEEPTKYHSDVIFLMGIDSNQAFSVFVPKPEVDYVWRGEDVIYSRRLSAERTKSRLNKITASPLYKSMTIRNWNTTMKLYEMVNKS
jgi:uncharacterized protein (DUF1697 family)